MPTPDFRVETINGVIAVSGQLDFSTAAQALDAVNEQLLAIPDASSDVHVIDLADVTHSNSAGLALLIEWLAEAQRTGRTIRFENIPNSLRQISTGLKKRATVPGNHHWIFSGRIMLCSPRLGCAGRRVSTVF